MLAGCVPAQHEIFDPVAVSVRERTGLEAAWHGDEPPAEAAARVRALLAEPLTADRAALIAVLHSPALQASYARLGVAAGGLAAARTPPNPTLHGHVRFGGAGDDDPSLELGAMQSLTGILVLLARSDAASAELRAVRRDATAQTIELAARARRGFAEAVAAEQALELRRSVAEGAAASSELARALRTSGNLTELDLTRELLFQEEAELEVLEAQARATGAREHLNGLLGLSGDETGWHAVGPLPDPPAELPPLADLEREVVAQSLDLDALRWRLTAAGERIGVARLESFLPDVGVGVVFERDEGGDSFGPAAQLSIPIFDWGQGRRAAAWADLRGLKQAYAATAIGLRAATRAARARLEAAHARVVRLRARVLPLRARLAAESLLQYNAMTLSAFDLLVVRREQIDTERRYLDALRDYWVADAEVGQLRAGAMPRGMDAPVPDAADVARSARQGGH